MGVLESFDESVEQAIKAGTLDASRHGAAIQAARKVAFVLDDPEWPIVRGKIDNVSPSVFLRYCDALGILPTAEMQPASTKSAAKLVKFTSSAKFAKAVND